MKNIYKVNEEAVKKIAERVYDNGSTVINRNDFEEMFPELTESDDERIRKAIIKMIADIAGGFPFEKYGILKKEALAWLEKQGEQILANSAKTCKVEPKFKVGDVVTNKKSKDTVKIVQILHDSYCYSGWDGAATVHSDFSISEQDDWELVKQNPAWSEEDENGLSDALWCCKQAASIAKDENDMGNVWFAENWLKSLRPRSQWKLSELPHWKKSTLPNDNTTGFNSDYFCHNGYCINYKELFEKLPKDD